MKSLFWVGMTKLRKILYVEDDPDIRTIAALALEKVGGFKVKTCSSGRVALQEVEAFDPDLIILDVMMPDMDGPATLVKLRADAGQTKKPVIFMTAKVMSSEIDEYKALGAIDVIPKPFDPMTLADRVRSIWDAANGEY